LFPYTTLFRSCVARGEREGCGPVVLLRSDAARSAQAAAGQRRTESLHPLAECGDVVGAESRCADQCSGRAGQDTTAEKWCGQVDHQIDLGEAAPAPRDRLAPCRPPSVNAPIT